MGLVLLLLLVCLVVMRVVVMRIRNILRHLMVLRELDFVRILVRMGSLMTVVIVVRL